MQETKQNQASSNVRLWLSQPKITENDLIKISGGDFEYLVKVMRKKLGDAIAIFNGIDGEFLAKISVIEKKSLSLLVVSKICELKTVPNLTLAFALIKNIRIDFLAAKATELGVARLAPIISDRCVVDKINLDRFAANVKEACEQCERNDFPEILPPQKLSNFLANSSSTILIFCDESGAGKPASILLPELAAKFGYLCANRAKISANCQPKILSHLAVIIGPEGGFSSQEFQKMRNIENCFAMSLGPRIMRADTAAIAALTLIQEFLGDFPTRVS